MTIVLHEARDRHRPATRTQYALQTHARSSEPTKPIRFPHAYRNSARTWSPEINGVALTVESLARSTIRSRSCGYDSGNEAAASIAGSMTCPAERDAAAGKASHARHSGEGRDRRSPLTENQRLDPGLRRDDIAEILKDASNDRRDRTTRSNDRRDRTKDEIARTADEIARRAEARCSLQRLRFGRT
jgi:hypothetical protein